MSGYLKTIIDGMVWSYSRLTSFDDCRYGWYLKYILGLKGAKEKFFSGFGSLIHELLEQYLSGKASPQQLAVQYLTRFSEETKGEVPSQELKMKYFENGLDYIKNLEPFPFKVLAAEQKADFTVGGKKFVGYIDVFGEDENGILIMDHKSKRLKPRSHRRVPTETDKELDDYLRQMYLYAVWLQQTKGVLPTTLMFNCFRDRRFLKERFDKQKFEEVKAWAAQKTDEISENEEFPPNLEYFRCTYLCDMKDDCEYYQANFTKR